MRKSSEASKKSIEVLEYDSIGGNHIRNVAAGALALAMKEGKPVHFDFNGTDVLVQPTDSRDGVVARWQTDSDAAAKAYREHPDRAKEAKERARKDAKARAAHMTEPATTEAELRDAKVPWPLTSEQLTEYIQSLVNRPHEYGTCVYAMSMAAEAAFNYVSGVLGVTGFQASMADLDFLRRTRGLKGPFLFMKAEDALYPQYDLPGRLEESMEKWKPWLKEEAGKLLASTGGTAASSVVDHWRKLAGTEKPR